MDSKKYWRAREEAQRQKDIKDADKYAGKIREIYQRANFNIQDQINAFYTKYATETGLSMAEVKKKVSSLDIERYNKLAEKYVRNKDLSQMANEAMRIYNLTMKINRLEMLKSEIGMELAINFSDVEGLFSEALNKTATDEIERQAGILGKTVVDTAKKADAIVNSSFNNATFSDRIWMHQEALRQDLNRVISNSIIQGKHPRAFIKDIVDRFDVSKNQADRLLITEVCRVQTEVQKQSYERDGYTEYEFIAEPTACPICKGLDGHIYKVAKMMPGENAPPLHPRCRCSTAPYMDRTEFDKWLDEHAGSNYKMNYVMDYKKVDVHNKKKIHIKTGYETIHAAKLLNRTNNLYISEKVKIKPKALQNIDTLITKSINLVGATGRELPKFTLIDYTELGESGGRFILENNNIFIKILNDVKKQKHALVHELFHWSDYQDYIKNNNKPRSEKEFIQIMSKAHKKKLDKLGINLYNVSEELGSYASFCYKRGRFDEVYTEYRTKIALKE